jgi:pyruvate dehydrogenase E2 component (dihydrolipoamide acetyltransferase)
VAHEFHLPDVGEGLTEAVVISWYVGIGEEVTMDAPLVEVETDKAVIDIPSPHAGVLLHQGAAPGETLEVDALLAVVGEAGEEWLPPSPSDTEEPGEAAPIVGRLDTAVETVAATASAHGEMLPRVRRLAAELGVGTAGLIGTGVGGRITEADVRAAAETTAGPVRRVKMSSLRRTIADRLARSWREIPHVTTYGEVDAAPLLAARAAAGKPPLEALLMTRIVPLLERFPAFNAVVDGDEIVEKLHYDIGFAVDTSEGLMVAVVKDAAAKSILELGDEIGRLAAAARDRTARPDELRGQTFTISNIGAVGGRYGTPIVPYGTTAILSVGRGDPRPVVRDGEVVVGREFPLSLSYDHRAIDGSTGRSFMAALIEALGSSDS